MSWTTGFDINTVSEIRTDSRVFLGVGAIKQIDFIVEELKKRGVTTILVVSGRSAYQKTGAWGFVQAAFEKHGMKHVLYNKVSANPETHMVDEAVAMGKEAGANAVLAIGGGSPLDAGKSAAILLANPEKNCTQLFKFEFVPEKAVPFVAINLTHGTGSEGNRFAVVTIPEENYKPAIGYDCIYPMYSIDDPALMVSLPPDQSVYVSVDAVNHVTEAATSTCYNPLAVTLGCEVVSLVATYLPKVMANPSDLEARYYLAYAALIAGVGFDNGLLHYTHALEHPLSGLKSQVTHGLGLAVLLPSVIREIYPARAQILAKLYAPIVPGLKGEPSEAEAAAEGTLKWLHSIGVKEKLHDLGFKKEDVEKMVDLAFTTPSLAGLLGCAPTKATREVVKRIYETSF
ncbi:putative alcohol dehydrogenase [Monocercomonoides exilis]|uniref:putative alcohol dehydrogenase n=1 Tax=Monocercomonoides exilis TaxID=2049356 RepID=UPI00355A1017|nr:putative alcohol dehydrogenase [Monocercomonoides exilis]|eukprot:MONOS_155.1-p1 / transcript=MONOS_155.1 / gene=MONOS_155 / organism=Monocercomonoides_exilis_PA203 / gene_product=alcohol dehydrogenase / transcript_product=alcohol dehydrogenase / location=Mono_scaffold00003:46563-47765(+) / protein_length=401 / sequence_SO=supercontig / SO=protein_coding / is_pseudo=false